MRELNSMELCEVSGAVSVKFTTPLTVGMLNTLTNFSPVAKYASGAFTAGYAVGTWLNDTFGISTRIVDAISN